MRRSLPSEDAPREGRRVGVDALCRKGERLRRGGRVGKALALALLVALTATGCGYAFATGGAPLPEGVQAVYVPVFLNRSSEAEAGAIFADALAEMLAREGKVGGPSAAARVEGEILSLTTSPEATTREGSGVGLYRVSGRVRLTLLRDGRAVCTRELRGTEEYIPSVNLSTLEASRREGVRRLANRMMRDAARRICS